MSVDTSVRAESERLFRRAAELIPGGVNSPARAFGAVGGTPPFMRRGDAAYLTDVDGNRFIDYIGSWGPHLFGHRHPAILQSIEGALEIGTSFGAPTAAEGALAELVVSMVPSIEMVRMVNSGTEATMSAIRVARGFTGRSGIIKFAGCYHGHVDSLLVAAGSGALTLGCPSSPGVPAGATADTLVLPYNDTEQLRQAFAVNGDQLAAVIIEPVVGNMGCVIPTSEFLGELRRLCHHHGTVLIFDEVMTGFRLAMGGAQEIYGITPDLTCYGKIIGVGLPVGAYAGRREIMEMIAPLGPVYQAGTLPGNPLGAAAGLASLELSEKDRKHFYQTLDYHSHEWADALNAHIESRSYPVCVARAGSMFTVFFTAEAPKNFSDAKKCDLERFKKFFWSLLNQGVYYPPSQFEACFLSARHDSDVMGRVIEASCRALDEAYAK